MNKIAFLEGYLMKQAGVKIPTVFDAMKKSLSKIRKPKAFKLSKGVAPSKFSNRLNRMFKRRGKYVTTR